MMQTDTDNPEIKTSWYKAAIAIAMIAGLTALVIITLISLSYVRHYTVEPDREEELEQLKIIVTDRPDNEKVVELIRELDLRIRRDKVNRLAFARRGFWLLLISTAVLIVSLKWIVTCRKKLPHPQPAGDRQTAQVLERMLSRRAVISGLGILVLLSLILAIQPHVDLEKALTQAKTGQTETDKLLAYPSFEQVNKNWTAFRGPEGNGHSAYTNVPLDFDIKTGKNVVFKTKIPLAGFNSPVVWENKVFVCGADEEKREVYCFDALSGRLLWTGDMTNLPGPDRGVPDVMEDTGFAAPTMATNGTGVFAIFATGDVGCFDLEGKRKWLRYFGMPDSAYGYASSLAIYQNLVLVQYDQGMAEDEISKMIALDAASGKTVWETKRPVSNSWNSPVVAKVGDKYQLITAADPWVIAYDPADGKELWKADCLGTDSAPSPVYSNGLVFVVRPYGELIAIRTGGQGDITKTNIAWAADDGIPDICSPLCTDQFVLLLTTGGTLTCYKVQDGQKAWEKKLDGNFNASPSLVGDKIYLLSIKGVLSVIRAGAEYEEISRSDIGENCFASPAFADGRIYIRTVENIYCFGNKN
ncbi:MAG: PQQ-binding-like beta-propeller repeat protein [Sedimentisphaerales bacterium]|nr:PQQ-binding-like beta-propeller repeat protein [Sedimentisphaerales bacterium]